MTVAVVDTKCVSGLWVKSYRDNGVKHRTKSYSVWSNMRTRCKEGGEVQLKRKTYLGCHMSEMFSNFQAFTDWHNGQVGYDAHRYQLDKDILFANNKLYSEDTCVLVPQALNLFLVSRNALRGAYPQGVSFNRKDGIYIAQVAIGGKLKHLGSFNNQYTAAAVYKEAKEAEAYRWYERLSAGEFIVDERVVERMRTWTLEEQQ